MKPQRIAIVGFGNVSSHLKRWFEEAGHSITSIYTRDSSKLHKENYLRDHLDYSDEQCDFILIATNDDSIDEIVKKLVHPSNIETLHRKDIDNYGVLYPLQTLQKGRAVKKNEVPFLIEGSDTIVNDHISNLCDSCGFTYRKVDSNNRKLYHLSAVIASNFTNHLLNIAAKTLESNDLKMDILRPLMEETVAKAFDRGAHDSQTGPAKRGDTETMKKHTDLLSNERYKDIYEIISQSIIAEHRQKD